MVRASTDQKMRKRVIHVPTAAFYLCVCVCLPVACFVVACQSAHITRGRGELREREKGRGMETRRRKRKQLHKWLTTTTTTAGGRLPVSCSGLCRLGGCRAEIVFFLFPLYSSMIRALFLFLTPCPCVSLLGVCVYVCTRKK